MGLCAASHSDGAGAGLPPGAFSLCFDSQLNAACSQLQAGNPLSVNQVGKKSPPRKKTENKKKKTNLLLVVWVILAVCCMSSGQKSAQCIEGTHHVLSEHVRMESLCPAGAVLSPGGGSAAAGLIDKHLSLPAN